MLRRARDWVEHGLQVEGRGSGGARVNRGVAGAGVIGGLLSAYDISGDPVLLARARQLADHLLHVSRGAVLLPILPSLSFSSQHPRGRLVRRAIFTRGLTRGAVFSSGRMARVAFWHPGVLSELLSGTVSFTV